MAGVLQGARWLGALLGPGLLVACSEDDPRPVRADDDRRELFTRIEGEGVLPSAFFEDGLVVQPGVFDPGEAETYVLPFMDENPGLFRGRRVLEIGTGSGVISLYAAKLGAAQVVATDIDPAAIASADENAQRYGFEGVLETRLVPHEDISAYSVIEPGERFDVIISNPPYSLDLDAAQNTYAVDTGDLGLSIVRGLPEHLEEDGVALLLYNSLFYHYVMVKFAESQGYEVRSQAPSMLTPWEAETLFNAYLERLLEHEGIEDTGLRFDQRRDRYLRHVRVRTPRAPLFPGNSATTCPGMIVIERD